MTDICLMKAALLFSELVARDTPPKEAVEAFLSHMMHAGLPLIQ